MRKLLSVLVAAGLLISFGAPVAAIELPKTYAQAIATPTDQSPFAELLSLFGLNANSEFDSASFSPELLTNVTPECQLAAAGQLSATVCPEAEYLLTLESGAAKKLTETFGDRVLDSFELGQLHALVKLSVAGLASAASQPWVTAIEHNAEFELQLTQSPAPWHLDRLDQPNLPLDNSFTSTSLGLGVKIYIMDTGISTNHNDFNGRRGAGYTFYNDGNGTNDCNGHGTHVAGSAAGTTYGAAKQATVVPVRVINCDGSGTTASVMAGINWIAENTLVGEPAVVNMSIGGAANATLDNAIESLSTQGLLFVVAAGNDNQNACNYSPARAPLAITVAASNRNDQWPNNPVFSNFGSCVDVIAPGVEVRSAFIGGPNSEGTASGTSMAAGVASGVAAIQMTNGHRTPAQIDNALKTAGVTGIITGVPAGTNNVLIQSTNFFPSAGGSQTDSPLEAPTETGDGTAVTVPPVTEEPSPPPPSGGGGGTLPPPEEPVVEPEPTPVDSSFNVWTVRMRDSSGNLTNQAKMYAKNPIGQGKVQFYLNGREIAWIRAVDETDPKLRLVTEGPMAGIGYLVRTVNLVAGKNALEIYVEGERLRRTAYTFIG